MVGDLGRAARIEHSRRENLFDSVCVLIAVQFRVYKNVPTYETTKTPR